MPPVLCHTLDLSADKVMRSGRHESQSKRHRKGERKVTVIKLHKPLKKIISFLKEAACICQVVRKRERLTVRQANKQTAKSRDIDSLFVGCSTYHQHASVSQGQICSDNFTCCHTEIEVADQTFNLTQSQYTDTRLTSPSTDPITPGAWQGSHWSHWYDSTPEKSRCTWDSNPGSSAFQADAFTTRPTRR